MTAYRFGRVVSYVVMILIGVVAAAPFLYLLVLSFKSRIDILTVPAGTKRATVLAKVADMDLGLEIGDKATVRVIPNEHMKHEHVEMVQGPPQLKVMGPGL